MGGTGNILLKIYENSSRKKKSQFQTLSRLMSRSNSVLVAVFMRISEGVITRILSPT